MALGGLGDVIGGLLAGNITNFGQAFGTFALSAVTAGVGYGISKGITKGMAESQYGKIIGNSTENIKINGKLANAGFKNAKIGRDGLDGVLSVIMDTKFLRGMNKLFDNSFSFAYGTAGSI